MSEPTIKLDILFGEMKFEPVKFYVRPRKVGWLRRTKWFVETDYATFGPFDTEAEATRMLLNAGERPSREAAVR